MNLEPCREWRFLCINRRFSARAGLETSCVQGGHHFWGWIQSWEARHLLTPARLFSDLWKKEVYTFWAYRQYNRSLEANKAKQYATVAQGLGRAARDFTTTTGSAEPHQVRYPDFQHVGGAVAAKSLMSFILFMRQSMCILEGVRR